MNDFENEGESNGFTMKLRRGERMCLLGFDVEDPEPDFVGFAVECRRPGDEDFQPLLNRLAFAYDQPVAGAVTGGRKFPSTQSPFQTFRWIHFPRDPKSGTYTYRATKLHMPQDGVLKRGTSIKLPIPLEPETYHGFLDVGFTRNFASSQAFLDKFPNVEDINEVGKQILPATADEGLEFEKMKGDIYQWLGFEAQELLFNFLDEAARDKKVELDVFAYDLNEPDLLAKLEEMGDRLRAIIDDSVDEKGGGHGNTKSAESKAAKRLRASAGSARVKRTHFKNLQHHKVLIAKRDGQPFKVLVGSTNFSFRGLYIQANNVLVFSQPDIAALYARVFEVAFADPKSFQSDEIASKWHMVKVDGAPPIHLCFSPHKSSDLSLNPVRAAIDQATSSVLYSVAFLNQIRSGPTKEAFDRLIERPVFSYGVSDKAGSLAVKKPDGTIGLVDFAFLAKNAPEPFKSEWQGGRGINIHHKFVVTDFNLATAKVFTGSSNLAPSGEKGNGDHLLMIEDCKVATGYAIEALRVFDHLHFRSRMRDALKDKTKKSTATRELSLQKPRAISGRPAWFERFYVAGSHLEADRKLFSR
jgi:phosphatidylserine/phosphatidylglycerophosphate/cardiolipin synthase-like enzyme